MTNEQIKAKASQVGGPEIFIHKTSAVGPTEWAFPDPESTINCHCVTPPDKPEKINNWRFWAKFDSISFISSGGEPIRGHRWLRFKIWFAHRLLKIIGSLSRREAKA